MGKNRTILLVDDEEKIVEVLQAYLEKTGYEVLCAYDGAAAMELFRNNDISLILLDLCFRISWGRKYAGWCALFPVYRLLC